MKHSRKFRSILAVVVALASFLALSSQASSTQVIEQSSQQANESKILWELKYDENFKDKPQVPDAWKLDTYKSQDDELYGERGIGFLELFDQIGGIEAVKRHIADLNSFKSYRKSYNYGQDGWLTVEAYGRAEMDQYEPRYGGQFVTTVNGAKLICTEQTDAVLIRSTNELPDTYRIEVTVSNIDVGGKNQDAAGRDVPEKTQEAWTSNGMMNGYDDTDPTRPAKSLRAGPWRPSGDKWTPEDPYATAYDQNGAYFLSIVDYANPKPHNNVFIHHHRKVAMDTDNNTDFEWETWSNVWNGKEYVKDGSRYISMLWMNGNNPDISTKHKYLNYLQTGQKFYTFNPDTQETAVGDVNMVDKFIPGNEYTFIIERTPEYYKMSATGKFYYGGYRTYEHTKYHLPDENNKGTYTWHFNQTLDELKGNTPPNDSLNLYGVDVETWPKGETYPDYFLTGMPHINYYSGSMEYHNLKLYLPAK